jgi:hypothetical protein
MLLDIKAKWHLSTDISPNVIWLTNFCLSKQAAPTFNRTTSMHLDKMSADLMTEQNDPGKRACWQNKCEQNDGDEMTIDDYRQNGQGQNACGQNDCGQIHYVVDMTAH